VQRGLGISFGEGEDMEWFDAHKYPEEKVRLACSLAGLNVLKVWKLDDSEMSELSLVAQFRKDTNCNSI
jgi:hypothetical protein